MHFVLSSAEEMAPDNSGTKQDQTGPMVLSSLPSRGMHACSPVKAPVEPSRELTAFHGSPLLAQLGRHLDLASGPFFSGTEPVPFKPPPPRGQSLRQASAHNTASTVSTHAHSSGKSHTTPPRTGNCHLGSHPPPQCTPSPGHTSSAVGAPQTFGMFRLHCFFCGYLYTILSHPLLYFTCYNTGSNPSHPPRSQARAFPHGPSTFIKQSGQQILTELNSVYSS